MAGGAWRDTGSEGTSEGLAALRLQPPYMVTVLARGPAYTNSQPPPQTLLKLVDFLSKKMENSSKSYMKISVYKQNLGLL